MSTAVAKGIKTLKFEWFLVDAADQVLGRLATRIATILMGKHKPSYTRHIDTGDHVVVINASKIKLTGKKALTRTYRSFSGYPGGLRQTPYSRVVEKDPTKPLVKAVERMLPKSSLAHKQARKLHVYADTTHPHVAQQPKPLKLS